MTEPEGVCDRVFRCGRFEVLVRHPRAETLAWAEEILAPWFAADAAPAAAGASRIAVSVDAGRFRGWLRRARPLNESARCFTMDAGSGWLPLLRADGEVRAFDAVSRFAVAVRRNGREGPRVDVFAEVERPGARLALLRVLRELATGHATRRGALLLHAGAVAAEDGVTAFVGDKMAGKSTLLVHALQRGGTGYVANDRLSVHLDSEGATALGVPTVVSLRDGALELSAPLREELASGAWHWTSTIAEARANREAGRLALDGPPPSTPRVSSAQLCALLGVGAVAGGPLRRIVFPEIARDGSTASFSLERLSAAEAARELGARGVFAGGRLAAFLSDAPTPGPGDREASLRALASRVACLRCRLGPDAYGAKPVWEEIRSFRG